MKKYNKIITKELNRILPYHLLGVLLHTVVIYMCFKIPQCIGNILDMLIDGSIDKDLIIHQAYLLIFFSIFQLFLLVFYNNVSLLSLLLEMLELNK